MGWNSVGRATSGWAYRRAEECRCSLWDSRKGKGKKCFMNRASLGIQSTSSVLGRLFRVGRPVPVQTAPTEKPGNPGKVCEAQFDLEAFLYLQTFALT